MLPVEAFDFFVWASPAVFWNKVYKIDADGTSNPFNWVGGSSPVGVCVDEETEQIFWTSGQVGGAQRIYVSNYDGTGTTILATGTPNSAIRGIDCDSNFVYWAQQSGTNAVRRCDKADGANIITLVDPGTAALGDIKVDLVNSHLYYTQASGGIRRCDLDGSNDGSIFGSGTYIVIYLDPDASHIYYSLGGAIRRVNYNGTGDTLIYDASGGSPDNTVISSLQVDLFDGKIYWMDALDRNHGRCDLDGGNPDKTWGDSSPGSTIPQRGDIAYPKGTFYAKPSR
ncbi:hypothetical protein LCGC14_1727510 [marine sediment metagenome]|uniref:Prolow-density lipoprotein receptor-related protein 1-like beta-propeller domain-containing protein n=1 Tax=marine sediment metagenome TaxID=412755 RepID=A0A0F9HAC9_9ZZZZ